MTFAAGVIVAWLVVAILTQSALPGDNIEQTIWAHSFEWGYYKHPPLPTWLLIAASRLLGPLWWLTNFLAVLCLLGTAFATYALARRLTTPRNAQLAILLWGLHLVLTWRVSLYNHNTVLILFCALMAWAVISAIQQRSIRYWLIAGAGAGLALLSKYQAGVLILVLLVALVHGKHLADPLHRRGVLAAGLAAALVFAPHAMWLVANDFPPLHYAGNYLPKRWTLDRESATVSFSLQQLRFFWPGWAAVLFCIALMPSPTRSSSLNPIARTGDAAQNIAWIRFLALGPLALVLAIGLAGTPLQNHWGLQTLQFACLGLAVWLGRRSSVRPRQLLVVASALHLLLLATVVRNVVQIRASGWQGHSDTHYPARELTRRALADWERVTPCPLTYVVGPAFEAGTISEFSGLSPMVFEGGSRAESPWIEKADVQRRGALYVAYAASELPATTTAHGSMMVTTAQASKRPRIVYWSVLAPAAHC